MNKFIINSLDRVMKDYKPKGNTHPMLCANHFESMKKNRFDWLDSRPAEVIGIALLGLIWYAIFYLALL